MEINLAFIFIVVVLLVGTFFRFFQHKLKLPYSILLLLFGTGLGLLAEFSGLNIFEELKTFINHIHPHVFLFIVLPTIIFESAFLLDVHIVRKNIANILFMAGPAFIFSTLFISLLTKTVLPIGWTWITSFIFGSIISATDPVAVVAVLKELKAGRRLTTLIEGESVLNDGAAIVFFNLFYIMLISSVPFKGSVFVLDIFRVSLFGALLGYILAKTVVFVVKHVVNDAFTETTIAITMVYFSYYLAEEVFHVSGVITVFIFGMVLAGAGKTRFSPKVISFFEHFWGILAYLANTIIFVVVGFIIVQNNWWSFKWIGILLVLYLAIHLIRGLTIILFFPLLKKIAPDISYGAGAILWWGDLRGVVGLSLALILTQDIRINQTISSQVLFLTAGLVALTLIINGTTAKALIRKLQKSKSTSTFDYEKITLSPISLYRNNLADFVRKQFFWAYSSYNLMKKYLPYLPEPTEHPLISNAVSDKSEEGDGVCLNESIEGLCLDEAINSFRQVFKKLFHEGFLGRATVFRLVEISRKAKKEGSLLGGFNYIKEFWEIPPLVKRFENTKLRLIVLKHYYDRLSLSYEIIRGFLLGIDEIEIKIISDIPDSEAKMQILKTCWIMKQEAGKTALYFRSHFPEICKAIETKTATRFLLIKERDFAKELTKNILYDEQIAKNYLNTADSYIKKLFNIPKALKHTEPLEVLKNMLAFSRFTPEMLADILKNSELIKNNSGLDFQSAKITHFYVVLDGMLWVSTLIRDKYIQHRAIAQGSLLGGYEFLSNKKSDFKLIPEGEVTLLKIPFTYIDNLLLKNEAAKNYFNNFICRQVLTNYLRKETDNKFTSDIDINFWLNKGEIVYLQEDLRTYNKIILISGNAEDSTTSTKYNEIGWVSGKPLLIEKGSKIFSPPSFIDDSSENT